MYGRLTAGLRTGLTTGVLGAITLVSVAYFTLALIALHFLVIGVAPMTQSTSAYAVGPYGVIMSLAFLALAVATVALEVGLRRVVPATARSGVGLLLLGVWAVGLIVLTLFPTDLQGAQPTLSGTIHGIASHVAYLAFGFGALLVSLRLGRAEEWERVRDTALILAVTVLGGYTAMLASLITGSPHNGLFQRLVLAALIAWYGLLGTKVLRPPRFMA